MLHEKAVYDKLIDLQGECVPETVDINVEGFVVHATRAFGKSHRKGDLLDFIFGMQWSQPSEDTLMLEDEDARRKLHDCLETVIDRVHTKGAYLECNLRGVRFVFALSVRSVLCRLAHVLVLAIKHSVAFPLLCVPLSSTVHSSTASPLPP